MTGNRDDRYAAVSRIITAAGKPTEAEEVLAEALRAAVAALSIEAAIITILSKEGEPKLSIREGREDFLKILGSLDDRMVGSVRQEFGVEHIYTNMDYQGQKSLFSYMLKVGDSRLGAISGICDGSRNLALENDFIEVIATALGLVYGREQQLEAARLDAVKQTSVTVSHAVNNPLTAVLGNVQLLLLKGQDLPKDVRDRLAKIEESSLRIRDVISRLMKLAEAKTTSYVSGTDMIDIGEEENTESGKKDDKGES
jgi:signal transduction histidine kinase